MFLNVLFWTFFASYVVHILDEALLNGGFVEFGARNFWPQYHVRMFFWFNAGASAGILTSLLYVIEFYLLVRYGVGGRMLDPTDCEIGTVVGVATIGAFLTIGPTVLVPWLTGRTVVTARV
jgi:hypothetical protein